jgi:DNA-binding NarL/FixJ family response regulator
MVRVLICDDQTVVREGLAAILSTDSEIEVVGLAENGLRALELVPTTQPDLVLMDLKMPVLNGVQATHRFRREHPEVRVLILTTYGDDQWVLDAIRAGASGYLLKDTRKAQLVDAIKGTMSGKSFLDPTIAGKVMQHAGTARTLPMDELLVQEFTEREKDVLVLLAEGHSNPEIAQQLHLAPGTVRNYVSAILQKLSVSDRTQAAVEAIRRGLLSDGSQRK